MNIGSGRHLHKCLIYHSVFPFEVKIETVVLNDLIIIKKTINFFNTVIGFTMSTTFYFVI